LKQNKFFIIIVIFAFIFFFSSISANGLLLISNFPINNSKTVLYVGGTGSGNYSTIQSAIDNASDGDTVFVYDDSTPYYENIKIRKRIELIGEDKNTTIIIGDDGYFESTVGIGASNVFISGFTLSKGGYGISISGDNNVIHNNIISFNYRGIVILDSGDHNIITNNMILHNRAAGIIDGGRDSGSNITLNIIAGNCKESDVWGGLHVRHSGGIYHHNDFYFNQGGNAINDGPWGSSWDDGSEGNFWNDWESNPGYPDVYIIPGEWEDGIDYYPSSKPYVYYPIVCIQYEYYSRVHDNICFSPNIIVDKSSVSWLWEFGDGTTSNESEPVHSYSNPGKYLINVTVTDNQGRSDMDKSTAYIGVPPDTPSIIGPTKCKRGRSYNYTIVASDSDGGNLYYYINWYDGSQDLIGPYPAGEEITVSHCWNYSHVYIVEVKAIDEADFESDWAYLEVRVPRTRTYTYHRMFERFPILERLLSLFR